MTEPLTARVSRPRASGAAGTLWRGSSPGLLVLLLLAGCSEQQASYLDRGAPGRDALASEMAGLPDEAGSTRPPLLLDVDMGLDDARVILALPAQTTYEVAGIVTVEGSAGAVKGADNALRLLAALGVHDIPVAIGAQSAMKGPVQPPSWRSLAEGLGGLVLAPAQRKPEPVTGQDFISKLLRQSSQPLRVVALGPLTDLALALKADSSLAKKICSLHLLGDFTTCTSYNCTTDLEAAQEVFSHKIPTVMVLSSATDKAPFDAALQAKVKAQQGKAADLVARMMASHASGVMKLWDDTVLAGVLQEKLLTYKKLDASTRQAVDLDLAGLHKLLLALWGKD